MGKRLKRFGLTLALAMAVNAFAPGYETLVQAAGADKEIVNSLAPADKNVAEKIKVSNLSIQNKAAGNIIDPNQSGSLQMAFDFELADHAVKAGDSFEIRLSENMNLNGDSTTVAVPSLVNSVGIVVATGVYDKANKKIVYTFTDYVEHSINVKGQAKYPLFVDRDHVTKPGEQTFTVEVAGESASTTLNVVFTLSNNKVDSFIPLADVNGTTNEFKQVVYVNRMHDNLYNTKLTIRADHFDYDKSEGRILEKNTGSIATINKENTTFSIYKVAKNNQEGFPSSFGVHPNENDKVRGIEPEFHKDQKGVEYVTFDFGDRTADGTGYIVIMGSKTSGKTGGLRVSAKVDSKNVFGEPQPFFYWNNENIIETSDTNIKGETTYNLGDYVWEDLDKDGIQDQGEPGIAGVKVTLTKSDGSEEETTTDKNGFYMFSNLLNGNYKLTFTTPEGYKATKTKVGDDRSFDSNGAETSVTIKDADDYTIDYGLVKVEGEGSFQESHYYYDVEKDFDGKEISRTKNTKLSYTTDKTSGSEDQTFTTKKDEKDDYRFTKVVDSTEGTPFHEDGSQASGNYVNGKDQSVTYEYEKVRQPGRFEDRHEYYIVYTDKDGNETRRQKVDEHTNQYQEGYRDGGQFTANPEEKDGYRFEKIGGTDGLEKPDYYQNGTTEGNYIAGEYQHITYIYTKTERDPEEPAVPEEPKEPKDPATPVRPTIPEEPKEPEEPVTPVRPISPEEPKDPVTPVTPSTPEEPKEPKDPVTPVRPTSPEEPKEPKNPTSPVTPEDPKEPKNPVTPVTPTRPEEPKEPKKPVTPGTSKEPKEPKDPSTPVTPEEPKKPLAPQVGKEEKDSVLTLTPEKPKASKNEANPEERKERKNPEQGDHTSKKEDAPGQKTEAVKYLPKTGAGINPSSYMELMGLAGGVLMMLGLKKKKEEEQE